MRALIIDDSKTARIALKRILLELGNWEILEAVNGQEALDNYSSQHNIDLCCVDWNMPVMNGLEFVTIASKHENFKGAWFMMVTSETEMDNIIKAMTAGANEYVMKPFTREIIKEKLEIMGLISNE